MAKQVIGMLRDLTIVKRCVHQAEIEGVSIDVEEKFVQPIDVPFTFKAAFDIGEQVLIS